MVFIRKRPSTNIPFMPGSVCEALFAWAIDSVGNQLYPASFAVRQTAQPQPPVVLLV